MTEANWWQAIRDEFPYLDSHTFVWWGGQSPLARTVHRRLVATIANWDADPLSLDRNEWATFDRIREAAAALNGCDARRMVLCENTSNAMSLAAAMILGAPGVSQAKHRNVVLHWEAHPAGSYPWLNAQARGAPIEIRWAQPRRGETTAESLLKQTDSHTLAVVLTDVSYLTGERFPIGPVIEARQKADWALVVDAAQSAGALPIDDLVQGADFVGYPAYKWLFGAPGAGFLVVSAEWLDRSGPPIAGWAATKHPEIADPKAYDPPEGGAGVRFGMPSYLPVAAAEEGLRLSAIAGPKRIADRIELLTSIMLEGLARHGFQSPTPTDSARRAGVIAVDVNDAARVNAELANHDIVTVPEAGRIRLDLHALNTEAEVERILQVLAELPSELRA